MNINEAKQILNKAGYLLEDTDNTEYKYKFNVYCKGLSWKFSNYIQNEFEYVIDEECVIDVISIDENQEGTTYIVGLSTSEWSDDEELEISNEKLNYYAKHISSILNKTFKKKVEGFGGVKISIVGVN